MADILKNIPKSDEKNDNIVINFKCVSDKLINWYKDKNVTTNPMGMNN